MRTDITNAGYGLGTAIVPSEQTLGNGPAYGHSGAVNGYRSAAYWFPEKKTAVVGLLDQSGADANALLLEALEALAAFTP